MPDEDFVFTDELHVARRRLANEHRPVPRLIALVNVQQRRVTFVNGEKLVLDD
jgi:hypothetical protein